MKHQRKARQFSFAESDSAIVDRLKRRTIGGGSFSAPCLPALFERYATKLCGLFEMLDRPLEGAELQSFRQLLRSKLAEGFTASPYARFLFSYRPLESNPMAITCEISIVAPSLEEQYDEWVQSLDDAEPFGRHADAKVMDVAREIAGSGALAVLDVGAGSGRNALPLARLGYQVDALEPVHRLADTLVSSAAAEGLSVSVIARDLLSAETKLEDGRFGLIVLSEVLPHFGKSELDAALPKLAAALAPRGMLLLSAFVADNRYRPSELATQTAQSVWSTFLTERELSEFTGRFELELVSKERVIEYEETHLPASAWPPTSWYTSWANGHNLFAAARGRAPIELYWLAYRRTS